MVTIHWLCLALSGLAIFAAGGLCFRGVMWLLYLAVRYRIWLATGGMRQLLDTLTEQKLHEVFGIEHQLLLSETGNEQYWTPLPGISKEDAALPEQPVLIGKSMAVTGFRDDLDMLPETLGVSRNVGGIFPLAVEFQYLFTCKGEEVDLCCHRRMSMSFYAFCRLRMGLAVDPVCGRPLDPIPFRPPRAMVNAARKNVNEAIAAVARGDHSEFRFFAMENPQDDDAAFCVMQRGKAMLVIFFGEPHALRLWSQRSGRGLRPITLEYKKAQRIKEK